MANAPHAAEASHAPSPWAGAYGHYVLVGIATLGLAAGAGFWWLGRPDWSSLAFALATLPVLLALLVEITQSLRRGDVGLDVVAALSMSAAMVFGETLAGNVVALMYAGGQLLEIFAQGRARREMTALLGRVAHSAMRYLGDELQEVPISTIVPGARTASRSPNSGKASCRGRCNADRPRVRRIRRRPSGCDVRHPAHSRSLASSRCSTRTA